MRNRRVNHESVPRVVSIDVRPLVPSSQTVPPRDWLRNLCRLRSAKARADAFLGIPQAAVYPGVFGLYFLCFLEENKDI
jgi:hypothetical protein